MTGQKALVAGVFGAFYHVLPFTEIDGRRNYGERSLAKPRGKLRIDYREKNTGYNKLRENLLAIGDIVEVGVDSQNTETMVIFAVEKRRNAIHRASFGRQQCLAANVDGVVVMASVRSPEFNLGFVERCLAEANIAGVAVVLVINKYDLAPHGDRETDSVADYYARCGFSIFRESIVTGPSEQLKQTVASGTWLILGQSGTGKSTLMNALLGEKRQAVGEISQIEKGRHTTTNPVLYYSPQQVQLTLVDVPGLREFGMHHREAQEIRLGYPDFLRYACRFEDCLHRNEPGCGVKAALERGELADFRYRCYLSILDSVQESFKPRKGDYWRGVRR